MKHLQKGVTPTYYTLIEDETRRNIANMVENTLNYALVIALAVAC